MAVSLRAASRVYAEAQVFRAWFEFFGTLLGYGLSVWCIYLTFTNELWLWYVIACFVGSLFMIKVFALFHDCTHHSMFASSALNNWVGRFLSLVITMPFDNWKFEHDEHHSHVSDMEKIAYGDIPLLTVAQFNHMSPLGKIGYRVFRQPLFFLISSPFLYFFLRARFAGLLNRRLWFGVCMTNLLVAVIYIPLLWHFGFFVMLFVFAPAAYFGGMMGVGLFYLQHNYPETHWFKTEAWEHEKAALEGSSLIVLPQPLEWFSHAIGYHHIHHLNSKIPGYRLRECYDAIADFQVVKPLTWRETIYAFKLKLWSYQDNRLVTVAESLTLQS